MVVRTQRIWDSSQYQVLTPPASSCEACPLHLEAPTTVGVPGVRCLDSLVPTRGVPAFVCIGQNPGRLEDAQGFPFVGPTGSDLHQVILRFLGVKATHTVYLLNAYRCFHDSGAPKPLYVARCGPHLTNDLQAITTAHAASPARFILCLGQPAWGSIARRLGVAASLENYLFAHQNLAINIPDNDGQLHEWRIFGTYHPAFIMRKRSAILAMQDHLLLVKDALDGILPQPSKPRIISPRFPNRSSS